MHIVRAASKTICGAETASFFIYRRFCMPFAHAHLQTHLSPLPTLAVYQSNDINIRVGNLAGGFIGFGPVAFYQSPGFVVRLISRSTGVLRRPGPTPSTIHPRIPRDAFLFFPARWRKIKHFRGSS